MLPDISGTLRKVTLDGVTYRVPNDINLTINLSAYETEGMPSTGNTMFKKILRITNIENCILLTNPIEADRLKGLANGIVNFTMSIELADGSIYRAKGQINYENFETEENRSTVVLIPEKALDGWTLFSP